MKFTVVKWEWSPQKGEVILTKLTVPGGKDFGKKIRELLGGEPTGSGRGGKEGHRQMFFTRFTDKDWRPLDMILFGREQKMYETDRQVEVYEDPTDSIVDELVGRKRRQWTFVKGPDWGKEI